MVPQAVPFIGRRGELALLSGALADSESGRGRLVALSGGPGMGKTRLIGEFARTAEQGSSLVVWSQMIEDPVAPPFFPWMLLLRGLLQKYSDEALVADAGASAIDLADLVPELRDRLQLAASRPMSGSSAARVQLFEAVTRFLSAASRRRPLVLLFDNLHLGDRSSIEMLEYYSQHLAATAALVVIAYRDTDLDHSPLRGAIARLSRNVGFAPLELGGLTRDEVALLLQTRSGKPPPTPLVDLVCRQSDGNPLFVAEVADVLMRREGSLASTPAGLGFRVPETLREVIAARLDLLPASCRRVLGLAAVLGRDFDADALCALAGASRARVLQSCEHAERDGLITRLHAGRYRFNHALFREVLYAEHGTLQRVTMHRRAAEYVEKRYGDALDDRLSDLAYHYFEAAPSGLHHKAVHFCRKAAETAAVRRAYVEAAGLYEQALQAADLQPETDDALQFELLLALGRTQYRAGQVVAASETLLKPALLAHRRRWWDRLAVAILEFQTVRAQTNVAHVSGIPLITAAIEHVDSRSMHARLLSALAGAQRMSGDLKSPRHTLARCIALARQCGDDDVLMECLNTSTWVHEDPPAVRAANLQESAMLAEKSGNKEALLAALIYQPLPLGELGEVEEIERLLVRINELVRTLRHPHYRNLSMGVEVALAILRGRWNTAVRIAGECVRQAPLLGVLGLEGRYGLQMFAVQRARGRLSEVAVLASRIIAEAEPGRLWLPGQILLHCELGQAREAKSALERLGDLDRLPIDDMYAFSLVYLADACVILRDERRARWLLAHLEPFRGMNASLDAALMLGAVAGFMAPLAVLLRRSREARELFDQAIAMNVRMGALPALARNFVDYGEWLLASSRPVDHTHARQLLGQAKPIARDLELQPLLDRLERLERQGAVAQLSRRELEVLKLIAAGASNKGISSTLHISHSTVATHVRNILQKIGAANRTEAAEYARRADLLGAD